MKNGLAKVIIAIVIGFIVVKTCSSRRSSTALRRTNTTSQTTNWQKSPIDDLIKKYSDEPNFSIILYDMDAEEPTFGSNTYKHKYRVLLEKPDTVEVNETEWFEVEEKLFKAHINDMGMEVASKKDGKVSKQAVPAGYNNYIGNPKYGHWTQRNGNSFWEFYGKYAFMSSIFNLMTYPARRSYWNDYRQSYYGRGKSYYGPSGSTIYGTKTYTSTNTGRSSTWGSKPSSFKSKVRNSVSRSSSSSSSRSYSSSSSYGRTSRSSSRSSSGSSFRSRSGGFGK